MLKSLIAVLLTMSASFASAYVNILDTSAGKEIDGIKISPDIGQGTGSYPPAQIKLRKGSTKETLNLCWEVVDKGPRDYPIRANGMRGEESEARLIPRECNAMNPMQHFYFVHVGSGKIGIYYDVDGYFFRPDQVRIERSKKPKMLADCGAGLVGLPSYVVRSQEAPEGRDPGSSVESKSGGNHWEQLVGSVSGSQKGKTCSFRFNMTESYNEFFLTQDKRQCVMYDNSSLYVSNCNGTTPNHSIVPIKDDLINMHGWFRLRSANSPNQCLDVNGNDLKTAQTFTCLGNDNQAMIWERPDGAASGKIYAVAGGQKRCLTGARDSKITWEACSDSSREQQWASNAQQQIYSPLHRQCVDIAGANKDNGAQLIMFDCHAGLNQVWKADLQSVTIVSADQPALCVDSYNSEDRFRTYTKRCDNFLNQVFRTYPGVGADTFFFASFGQCLDRNSASAVAFTPCDINKRSQQWGYNTTSRKIHNPDDANACLAHSFKEPGSDGYRNRTIAMAKCDGTVLQQWLVSFAQPSNALRDNRPAQLVAATTAQPAAAAGSVIDLKLSTTKLESAHAAGKCLGTAANQGAKVDADAQIVNCSTDPANSPALTYAGSSKQLISPFNGRYLQATAKGKPANFLKAENTFDRRTNTYAPGLQWEFLAGNVLRSPETGLCLDIGGWSKDEGAKVIMWDCTSNTNQRWLTIK